MSIACAGNAMHLIFHKTFIHPPTYPTIAQEEAAALSALHDDERSAPSLSFTASSSSGSSLASGSCLDFCPLPGSDHLFLVGTEEGRVHKCSKAYSGQVSCLFAECAGVLQTNSCRPISSKNVPNTVPRDVRPAGRGPRQQRPLCVRGRWGCGTGGGRAPHGRVRGALEPLPPAPLPLLLRRLDGQGKTSAHTSSCLNTTPL